MRIGFDARLINESGVGRYIRNVLPLLIEKNKRNNWVITVRPEEKELLEKLKVEDANLVENNRVKIVEVNSRWHSFKEQFEIPYVFYKEGVDLLHIPYINVPIMYFKKFAVTIHDLTVLTHKTGKASTLNPIKYFIKRIGYRLSLNKSAKAHIIFTVSNTVKNEIIEKFPKIKSEKIIVTYNGFSKLNSKRVARVDNFLKNISNYFFYVGNCHPHKNLEFLVDTLSKFFEKFTKYKMIFAGREDFFMQRLENYVSNKKMHKNFIFYKNPSDEELYALYKKSKLVILPSLKEGFGMQLLEAMQLSCTLLISNIPAFREIGGSLPIYFNPESKRSLIIGLNKALKIKPTQKRNIVKKYKVHLKKFSWENTAEEILRAYDNKEAKSKKLISKVG